MKNKTKIVVILSICILLLMSSYGCQKGFVNETINGDTDNELINDQDLFIRIMRSIALDRSEQLNTNSTSQELLDKQEEFKYNQIKCFIIGDLTGMSRYYKRYKAIYNEVYKIGLAQQAKRYANELCLPAKGEILSDKNTNLYKELKNLSNERSLSIDEIFGTVYYDYAVLEGMDVILGGHYIENNYKFTVTIEDMVELLNEENIDELEKLEEKFQEEQYDAIMAYENYIDELAKSFEF